MQFEVAHSAFQIVSTFLFSRSFRRGSIRRKYQDGNLDIDCERVTRIAASQASLTANRIARCSS